MSRNDLLTCFRIAGYHGDTAGYTRLLIENRIRRTTATEAYQLGQKLKTDGMKCSCRSCNKPN